MLIQAREKLISFFQKASPFCAVGVALHPNCIDVVALQKSPGGELTVPLQSRIECDLTNWQQPFAEFVKEHTLDSAACQLVLAQSQYQLTQIDKPQVPDEELSAALKWSVKDIVPNSESLAMDYFDVPVQNSGIPKINLVTSNIGDIQTIVKALDKLELKGITIEELTWCSLASQSEKACLLVTQQPEQDLRIMVVKDGMLFFSRTVSGYSQLSQSQNEMAMLAATDALSLEVQRSMDYFEASLRQGPISEIRVGLPQEYNDKFVEGIRQNFDVDIGTFEMPTGDLAEGQILDSSFFPALSAALDVAHGRVS